MNWVFTVSGYMGDSIQNEITPYRDFYAFHDTQHCDRIMGAFLKK